MPYLDLMRGPCDVKAHSSVAVEPGQERKASPRPSGPAARAGTARFSRTTRRLCPRGSRPPHGRVDRSVAQQRLILPRTRIGSVIVLTAQPRWPEHSKAAGRPAWVIAFSASVPLTRYFMARAAVGRRAGTAAVGVESVPRQQSLIPPRMSTRERLRPKKQQVSCPRPRTQRPWPSGASPRISARCLLRRPGAGSVSPSTRVERQSSGTPFVPQVAVHRHSPFQCSCQLAPSGGRK